ncbi:TPA: hypothetical protein MIP56_01155 [Klebsiella pneumoniae]|nr:hypothetical protein [Klebsiella pneumoniae]
MASPGGAALTGPTMCQPVIGPCRPGKAQPPPGINAAPCLMPSPGGAVACRAYRQSEPDE